jgi:phospholipase/lecithinase/hemolysin
VERTSAWLSQFRRDPATYFFYHEGHPSTAVHRIVEKKLFEEIAARPRATR